MKLQYLLPYVCCIWSGILFGQTNQTGKMIIPFLDKESQSSVNVTVSDLFGKGLPCPTEYTNTLSNTNLFSFEEQKLIRQALTNYIAITPNSGPQGTELVGSHKTNVVFQVAGRKTNAEHLVAQFQYTNSDAREEITFGAGLLAKYRTKSNAGYNLYIGQTGSGSILRFMTVKDDRINGILVEFDDPHPQGLTWDYKNAEFANSILTEYRQYTNGLVFGRFFMWDIKSRLMLAANFKEPYDFEKHRGREP